MLPHPAFMKNFVCVCMPPDICESQRTALGVGLSSATLFKTEGFFVVHNCIQ